MRFRLRTLLILMAVAPPAFAAMLFAGILHALLFSLLIAIVAYGASEADAPQEL